MPSNNRRNNELEFTPTFGTQHEGNRFANGNTIYLPLYEAKMMHHFNHRFGDYLDLQDDSDSTQLPEVPINRLKDSNYEPLLRYWVLETEVNKITKLNNGHLMGFRGITNTTNERCVLGTVIPLSAVGNSFPIWQTQLKSQDIMRFVSCMSNFACDFVARFKLGGTNFNFFIAQQLAVLSPETYTHPACLLLGKSLTAYVLELLYTSHSLQPFAQDCGYDGPPFIWDEERRFEIRCELDALYFHLYLGTLSDWQTQGTPELLSYLPTPRHAVEYIMETFPIVKRKDLRDYGTYRTKLRILEICDQMTHCLATNTEYRSTLNPLPGPPCDSEGNFIPVEQWDKDNWPKHIHNQKENR